MVCKGKQRIIGVIWNSCRVRGQKSKLSYRYAELGTVKVKKKTRNVQVFSLFSLSSCPQERKRTHSFSLLFTATLFEFEFFFFFFILGFSLFQMLEYNDQHTPKNNQGHKEGRRHEQHRTRTSDAGIT